VAEAFLAGLIGFLIGRGVSPQDARAVVEALQTYIGFEPPLGLTGYALEDLAKGAKANAVVVVRGKAYDAIALDAVTKHSEVSVLGKKDGCLQIAPTISSLKSIETVETVGKLSRGTAREGLGLLQIIDIDQTLTVGAGGVEKPNLHGVIGGYACHELLDLNVFASQPLATDPTLSVRHIVGTTWYEGSPIPLYMGNTPPNYWTADLLLEPNYRYRAYQSPKLIEYLFLTLAATAEATCNIKGHIAAYLFT